MPPTNIAPAQSKPPPTPQASLEWRRRASARAKAIMLCSVNPILPTVGSVVTAGAGSAGMSSPVFGSNRGGCFSVGTSASSPVRGSNAAAGASGSPVMGSNRRVVSGGCGPAWLYGVEATRPLQRNNANTTNLTMIGPLSMFPN